MEKYRPKTIDEMVLPPSISMPARTWIKEKRYPSVVMAGPPGTGKTSLSYILAGHIVGHPVEYGVIYDDFIEMNAADERKLEDIRPLQRFASTDNGSLRVVFLDEADQLPDPSQGILRAMMEKNYKHCRWFLGVNFKEKLLDAIVSRCATFDFPPLPAKAIIERVTKIAKEEGIQMTPGAMELICNHYDGDLRRVMNDGLEKLPRGQLILETDIVTILGMNEYEVARGCLEKGIDYYLEKRQEIYIDPKRLIKELFTACGRKRPDVFATADYRIGATDPVIQIAWILSEIRK